MKLNKFIKWLDTNKIIISAKSERTILFNIDDTRYKLSCSGSRVTYLDVYKLESQSDISLPDIKTNVVAGCRTQQDLITEFEKYLDLQ